MSTEQQQNTTNNIVTHMSGIEGHKKNEITNRQLSLWYRVDGRLGAKVADGLEVR
ncbi:MAG: catalase [Flavobacterium sp.]|jgi:catalase